MPTAVAGDPAPAASAESVSQADLLARLERKDPDLVVLDVRTPAEFAAGHVPGARNISHELLASRLAELAPLRDKQVVLYCRSGRRTLLAADVLHAAGFTRLRTWKATISRGKRSIAPSSARRTSWSAVISRRARNVSWRPS